MGFLAVKYADIWKVLSMLLKQKDGMYGEDVLRLEHSIMLDDEHFIAKRERVSIEDNKSLTFSLNTTRLIAFLFIVYCLKILSYNIFRASESNHEAACPCF